MQMASSKDTFCDICQADHVTNTAEEYCPQCEEALCSTCHKHHKLSKATKAHQTITIFEYNKLPPFIRSIKQYCDEHGDLFEFYCASHDDFCCKRCVMSTHRECKETKVLQDYFNNSSSSTALESLEKSLVDIEANITEAIKDRKKNLEAITEQKLEIETKVKFLRQNINDHLDKLELHLMQKITEIEDKNKQEILELIQNLEGKRQIYDNMKQDTEIIKKHASNTHMFMGIREMEKSVTEQEKYIQSMYEDKTLSQINLVCELDKNALKLTDDIKTLGTVSVKKIEPLVSMRRQVDRAAQIYAFRNNNFDVVSAKRTKVIKSSCTRITGCVRFPDSSILFMTETSSVLKYKCGQTTEVQMPRYAKTFDAAIIDDSRIAVTSGGSGIKQIFIMEIGNLKTEKILSSGDYCYGITCHKESLYFCAGRTGVQEVNIVYNTMSDFPFKFQTTLPGWRTYITSYNNLFYHSDHNNHTVTCFEFDGRVKWTFSDTNILNEPQGITVDSRFNIYVAGTASNNVVLISSDGKRVRQLLGPADGLCSPRAIFFDKNRNQLLVANTEGSAFLFDIQQKI